MITYWYVMNEKLFHGSGDKSHLSIQDSLVDILPISSLYQSNFVLAFDHEINQLTLLKHRMGNVLDELLSRFIHKIIAFNTGEIRIPTSLLDGYTLTPDVDRKLFKSKLILGGNISEPPSIPHIDIDYNSIHVGWFMALLYLIATNTEVSMDTYISVSMGELETICEMNYETSRNFSMLESIWYMTRTLYESP